MISCLRADPDTETVEQKRVLRAALMLASITLGWSTMCLPIAAQEESRQVPLRDDKLRIIVDKVVSYESRPRVTDSQVQEIAQAGFNVLVPRWGGPDLNLVREGAQLAQKHGMKFMPWIRGSGYTQDPKQMMVWRDGAVGTKALTSPNSDQLWETISKLLVGHAKLSTEIPSIIGAFVDFENYDTHGGYGHCYPLSYDEIILVQFGRARKIEIPSLPHKERFSWLEKNDLHQAFAEFQIESWRQRCHKLRQDIDEINPHFRLAVYPVPGPLFVTSAVFGEWSTATAPLILADAATYGRPMGFVNEQASLRENRRKLLDHLAFAQRLGFPFQYTGGMDPIVDPGNPEFFGKNADMIASVTDGYWVFYEGATHGEEDHRALFDWLTQANNSIRKGLFNLQYQQRKTPEFTGPDQIRLNDTRPLILHEGLGIGVHKDINRHGGYHAHFLESLSESYLGHADAVILQSAMRWLDCDPRHLESLRQYVARGGNLFITNLGWSKRSCGHLHDTIDSMPTLNIHEPPVMNTFSNVAGWSAPTHATCQGRYVLDNRLTVTNPAAINSALSPGTSFTTSSPNHMVLRCGPNGQIVVKNKFGDPVCIAGSYGKGKVVFSGCAYGFWAPGHPFPFGGDDERRLFYSILEWLVSKN